MKCRLTCVANHGIMIESKSTKIMVDAIHEGANEYGGTLKETIHMLKNNVDDYKGVSTLLFTHSHSDHFSSNLVNEVLEKNKSIDIILDQLSYEKLQKQNIDCLERVTRIPYKLYQPMIINSDSFNIIALPMKHYGSNESEVYDVDNFSYIITISHTKIFISGDGEACEENYKNYASFLENIDVGILCFPYIFTSKGQKIVNDYINPKQLIINHIPDENKDVYNIRPKLVKYYEKHKDKLPSLVFFDKYNETFEI